MATEQTEKVVIKKTPDVCGGDACIGNRRIPVWQILECRRVGMTDETIMAMFQTPLAPAELEAASAYIAENREEIEACLRENEEAMLADDPDCLSI
jgi:uncharacterized protein (DUF433 family)